MIYLKSPEEIAILRQANQIVAKVMQQLKRLIIPGVRTIELDSFAEKMILDLGGRPAFKGYKGFPGTLCVSVNEEVVHGIPGNRVLEEGDIVSVDCGVLYNAFYGDHAWTFPVGEIAPPAKEILEVGAASLAAGIEKMVVGNRLFDISNAVQSYVEERRFSVVRDFVGHGIGKQLHEEPQLPNFGVAGTGMRLKPGLVLAIEPMVNQGSHQVKVLQDGWTVVTEDKKLSVHFEHSVAITENGPEILSAWLGENG